ncbi:M20 family metallo-hydrolase [Bradyrhizobium sp.]|uniref:M20 family metallo-hydrolase n=1 Tax=Bradyrhizobium sp. TaxID=376 RepID=UPI0025BFD6F5|nr:M20 family metallo-hydrolase [Bradyrhizobium sp.]
MTMIPNLKIDPQRLWDTLMETAKIGGTPKGGIRRLTLTDEDKRVRDWFRAQCEALGCVVTVDEVGTMFARRAGKDPKAAPIAFGSHLDTQPTGGKFDGTLGVLAGLELLRTLNDLDYRTNAPLELVNWTNEEGSRFAPAMLASGVFAGAFTREHAYSRKDRDGVSFGEALDAIGYRGTEPAGKRRFAGLFELHIEQGPILEKEAKMVGVVTGVQGMRWYEVTVTGQDAHTGATPMYLRKNALLGAARMIDAIDAIAHAHAPDAVGTVGLIENKPNSRNVIPGEVFFTVDLRHPSEATLDVMEREFRAALERCLTPLGLTFSEVRIWTSPAVAFAPELIACVREGAAAAGFTTRDMVSGAGHDAAYLARVTPTTMIFVPCAGGVSHNEAESTSFDECAAGAQTLLEAVLAYDRRLSA